MYVQILSENLVILNFSCNKSLKRKIYDVDATLNSAFVIQYILHAEPFSG